ncbi:hypothetical protein Q1695_000247 [Nippostrongylus brasiliensis]|nr:hypothetical protein Q1695_000247 [Nippostrongylus brasiliensis]
MHPPYGQSNSSRTNPGREVINRCPLDLHNYKSPRLATRRVKKKTTKKTKKKTKKTTTKKTKKTKKKTKRTKKNRILQSEWQPEYLLQCYISPVVVVHQNERSCLSNLPSSISMLEGNSSTRMTAEDQLHLDPRIRLVAWPSTTNIEDKPWTAGSR